MFKSLYVHKVYGLSTFKEAIQRFQFVIYLNFFIYNLTLMLHEPLIFLSLIYHNFGLEIYGRVRMVEKTWKLLKSIGKMVVKQSKVSTWANKRNEMIEPIKPFEVW
jgi:hypothetical protein